MGEAAKLLKPMEAEAYLAWEEGQPLRHELVEGVPYAMAGASRAHKYPAEACASVGVPEKGFGGPSFQAL